jgi:hypothetical protein
MEEWSLIGYLKGYKRDKKEKLNYILALEVAYKINPIKIFWS